MKALWRISGHNDLEGLGGERADGRWHRAARGKRIVYLSEHPALALIETLVNLKGDPGLFPDTYQLLKVLATEDVSTSVWSLESLADTWRDDVSQTQSVGDSWLADGSSALLAVPSIPSPESMNYLFNPLHPEANQMRIDWCKRVAYDKCLFRIS